MDNLIKTYDDILDSQTCNNIVGKFEQFENQHEEFDDKGIEPKLENISIKIRLKEKYYE